MNKIEFRAPGVQPGVVSRQIDFGCYVILQANATVGRVCVVPASEDSAVSGVCNSQAAAISSAALPERCVEHWCLYSNYLPPSSANPSTTLTFLREENPEISCFSEFIAHATQQTGARYIRAECVASDTTAILLAS